MNNTSLTLIIVDIAAALVLTLGIYYPRHRRRDLVVAFLGVNIGVLAVATVLATVEVAVGLGLGLFGVLSIIRLRSSEISQREVAYYFAALAMGLIGGLATTSIVLPAALIALILLVLWGADHPAVLNRSRQQVVKLGQAIADEHELRAELERMLGATVTALNVKSLDLVNGTTSVDVRFRLESGRRAEIPAPRASAPAQTVRMDAARHSVEEDLPRDPARAVSPEQDPLGSSEAPVGVPALQGAAAGPSAEVLHAANS